VYQLSVFKVIVLYVLCAGLVSGCSATRTSPQANDIVYEATAKDSAMSVVHVSRANVDAISHWPAGAGQNATRFGWPATPGASGHEVIRPGDTVSFVIWDSEPNSLLTQGDQRSVTLPNLTVSPEGSVFIPYAGQIMLNGMTQEAARQAIQLALQRTVPSAQVMLRHDPGRLNAVEVVDGLARPGAYPVRDGGLTILSLITQAGGMSPALKDPYVRLIRGKRTYETQGNALMAGSAADIFLQGGDKIVVAENTQSFTTFGATGAERMVPFTQDRITALEAIALSGGLAKDRADLKGLLVLRDYDAKALRAAPAGQAQIGPETQAVIFALDLSSAEGLFAARHFTIQPGDTVLATESPLVPAQTLMRIVASMISIRNSARVR
jgi:polysaccharide biosynthesis/export protein